MVFTLCSLLDLQNNTYSGYWYSTETSHEPEHYHSGISHGTVLGGEMILVCMDKKFNLKKQDGFLLPPNSKHTAEMIAGPDGFLFFATIVGLTTYTSSSEELDVQSYYEMTKKHYKEFHIDTNHVAINI